MRKERSARRSRAFPEWGSPQADPTCSKAASRPQRRGTEKAAALSYPFLAGLAVLIALPAAGGLALAFTDFSGIGSPRFVGAENFSRLFSDELFFTALGNSVVFIAIAVPLRLVAAVGAALVLHRAMRGAGAARASVFLPSVVPDVAYALLWLWILNPIYGPLALALAGAGLPSPDLLTHPWGARAGIAFMGAFQIGEAFVVALASRRTIPERLYEAAAVEGASPFFVMTRLTLPVMGPILALLALRDVVLSFQVSFVPALVITEGGPRYATTYLPLLVYQSAFRYLRLGYASAMALSTFAIMAAIVYVQYRLARRWRLL